MRVPVLSIIVPTYNHEKYIRKTFESIIYQPKDFEYEILCIDDNSQDNTPQLLKKIKEENPNVDIRLFLNEKNEGVARNVYYCFMEARGKYITLLEGDDYWEITDELKKSVDFLEKSSEFLAISRNTKCLDEKTNELTGLSIKLGKKDRVTNICNYFKGAPIRTCIYRNFYLNKDEDFSVIYKSARMLSEIAIGFLIVEHGAIFHTGNAWEVKRTDRIEGASNYNSITKSIDILEEYMNAYATLEKYRPEYDFFSQYKCTLVEWFWRFFYAKNWMSVRTFHKYVKQGHRIDFGISLILSIPKYFMKYISDKKKALSLNK